ncbi:CatB-related O-acetyltransferase [Streptomyces fractus]|uniref:CatB-related O-acetyltransferase n=1 Tax=Streptomyces fractus TaxID=641806 RepID=UPI003CEC32BB
MKVEFGKIKGLLQQSRIFLSGHTVGAVTKDPFYKNELLIEIPDDLAVESYSAFYDRSGQRLGSIGSFSYTRSVLDRLMTVGRYSSIAPRLQFLGAHHPLEWTSASPTFFNSQSDVMATLAEDTGLKNEFHHFAQPSNRLYISVGNDVWIGQNVTLGRGITVGDGAVIAANSLVVKNVLPYQVVGGNPAKPIKMRFDDKTIDRLLRLRWWQYSPQSISDLDIPSVERFCDSLEERVLAGEISPMETEILTTKRIRQWLDTKECPD